MERRILESLFAVCDPSSPKDLSTRMLRQKAGSDPAFSRAIEGLVHRGLVKEVRGQPIEGYAITKTGASYYLNEYLAVDPSLRIDAFNEETLEVIAIEIGNALSDSDIRRFLDSTKIPAPRHGLDGASSGAG